MKRKRTVTELLPKQEKVRMIEVARLLNKPTGTVNSAMKILSAGGILKTDHSGEITLLEAKKMSTL